MNHHRIGPYLNLNKFCTSCLWLCVNADQYLLGICSPSVILWRLSVWLWDNCVCLSTKSDFRGMIAWIAILSLGYCNRLTRKVEIHFRKVKQALVILMKKEQLLITCNVSVIWLTVFYLLAAHSVLSPHTKAATWEIRSLGSDFSHQPSKRFLSSIILLMPNIAGTTTWFALYILFHWAKMNSERGGRCLRCLTSLAAVVQKASHSVSN